MLADEVRRLPSQCGFTVGLDPERIDGGKTADTEDPK